MRTFLRSRHFLIFISILILCICFGGISGIYCFSVYPDEFGYWSPAASLYGYDWSQVASIGSYYSYGYSFVLFIIFSIFKDGIMAYRAALVLNAVMQCACVWIIYRFICELRIVNSEGKDSLMAAIISSIAVLYPAWSLYSQSTMTESFLCFLFVFVSFLVYKFLKSPSIISGILLGIFAVYLYLVHMRMIGTLIAIVLTFVIWAVSCGNRRIRIGILSLIVIISVIFFISFAVKSHIVSNIYTFTVGDTLNWNDYNGQLPKILKIFSLQGLLYMFENISGKVLYISLSTYGIGIWGIYALVSLFIKSLKAMRNKGHHTRALFQIYMFCAVFLQIGVAIIYLIDSPSPDNPRLDLLLHGRYIDLLIPVLFIYGIYAMYKSKKVVIVTIIISCIDLILSLPVLAVINNNNSGMPKLEGFMTAGVSYMLSPTDTDSKAFLIRALVFGIVLSWCVCLIIILSRKNKAPIILSGILLVQIVLSVFTCNKYLYSIQSSVYADILTTRQIEKLEEDHDRQIVHIYEGGLQYIEVVQFNLRSTKIDVVNTNNGRCDTSALPAEAIIVTSEKTTYDEELSNKYDTSLLYGHLKMYFNEDNE